MVPDRGTWQLTAGAAVAGLAFAAAAVTAAGPWDDGQRRAEREHAAAHGRTGGADHQAGGRGREEAEAPRPAPAPSAPGVLHAASAPTVPAIAPAALADALGPLLDDPGLGPMRSASVVDAATGGQLYGRDTGTAMVPASTVKIATAAAVLSATSPAHRIPTRVVATPDFRGITLVGGGDPTLDLPRMRTLADRTAKALRDRGVTTIRLTYDTSLYRGPLIHPIGAGNDNIAPVTALMVNAGRLDDSTEGPAPRSADPAGDAARAFVGLLSEHGVNTDSGPAPGKAPAKGPALAATYSAPVPVLVERMLTNSDNDLAEALARQTALATRRPASFAGAEAAVTDRLTRLKLPLTGARFADGSGLNRADRVSAALLTTLLVRAADPARPELRPVLTGLPVAGFTGTLSGRAAAGSGGLVRAKTGTLSGVDTLAGTVSSADGRLLAFAFLAGDTPSASAARPALDRLAAALLP
ncbi:D-alanyl-D-alanine carboxypeptidase/D-alanyl-D-alanine endopeptidase [Streptomyces pacificus]|uniref:D-alanyl-D-alanine carboxypeptidase/D-alanyl-D-alanine-endopeptidase n=1 Tax=Streptomyces pacificus TaxID=2705029 RepID=A0A6A0B3R4_9ACTN|nr:D-alanyl-D-alanine carboxypeptidase/D-alanyl-D-alanine-endopeptidase [Streptomyces pacificus]GFH39171.1 D-alanyl-D-alanine carboxypeptidase/D-alanyl-D-alanine-endopeptidase [Streptomyces pacificus]